MTWTIHSLPRYIWPLLDSAAAIGPRVGRTLHESLRTYRHIIRQAIPSMPGFPCCAVTRGHHFGGDVSTDPSSFPRWSIFISGTVGGVRSYSSGDRPHAIGQSQTIVTLCELEQGLRMNFTGSRVARAVLHASVGSAPKRLLASCLFACAAHHVTPLRMQNIRRWRPFSKRVCT